MLVVIDCREFIACIMLCVCFYLGETNSKNKQVPNYSHTYG